MDTVGHTRNLAIITVAPAVIVHLMTCGNAFRVVDHGLPHGTKFKSMAYDHRRDLFVIVVEHETFPRVTEGSEIPELEPVVIAKI